MKCQHAKNTRYQYVCWERIRQNTDVLTSGKLRAAPHSFRPYRGSANRDLLQLARLRRDGQTPRANQSFATCRQRASSGSSSIGKAASWLTPGILPQLQGPSQLLMIVRYHRCVQV